MREVRPFSHAEIALLETFADQAVIAIENARLFQELEQRTAELTEALEQQTALREVLRVIASSPTESAAVLERSSQTLPACASADRCVRPPGATGLCRDHEPIDTVLSGMHDAISGGGHGHGTIGPPNDPPYGSPEEHRAHIPTAAAAMSRYRAQ